MDWRHHAACREVDPELFFPIGNTGPALFQIEEAKGVCRRCPVAESCLQWAVESGQDAGVWGGMSEDERRAYKRRARPDPGSRPRLNRTRPPRCGHPARAHARGATSISDQPFGNGPLRICFTPPQPSRPRRGFRWRPNLWRNPGPPVSAHRRVRQWP